MKAKLTKYHQPNYSKTSLNSTKGGNYMKKIAWIIVVLPFLLAGCKTQKQASTANNDDVYSHPVHTSKKAKTTAPDADLSAPQALASADSTNAKAPASATYDDYNDYSYSARVKRFHHPEQGKGYYDETYTNPSNYDSNASNNQDVNTYGGSGNGSCCSPSLSFGFGWGNPYSFGWGTPYGYGWDWGWYPNYYGYNPWAWSWYYPYYPYYPWGYWGGYNDWYNGYGFPYSYTNTFNGRRKTLSSNNGIHAPLPSERSNNTIAKDALQKNQRTANDVNNQRLSSVPATRANVSKINPAQQHYRYTRPATRQSTRYTPNTSAVSTRTQVKLREQPVPKYTRPEAGNMVARSSEPQHYSSPAYRQPKSSQEYLNPRTQVNRNPVNPGSNNQGRYTAPSNNERRSSYPQNNGYNRSYSPSTRSYNSGYSQPSRSFNNSFPSRSGGGGYSPSRSGGGSSGGGGGSHSSGGGSHSGGGGRK